ncbi:MAG: threonylcarbamoyl-AMP synthase [Ruminococcus sp.]|nr:threonylcarbamoyl-AMP synthase [Candidatus Copronaster equi]
METKFYKIKTGNDINIFEPAGILKNGGLVAIPTETVYGLAANALDPDAVRRIFKAKGRPSDNPLIVHISKFDDIYKLVEEVPENAKKLAEAFWPGPLTMVLKKSEIIPDEVSAKLDTVAIRMPSHPVARGLIEKSGCPLAAPSANSSGLPSPTTARHVADDMNGKIDAIVDGGHCSVGIESTVVTLATDIPRLLRPGGITLEQLESVLGHVDVDEAILNEVKTEHPASPGMKYKHYSPKAEVTIIEGSLESFKYQVECGWKAGDMVLCFDSEDEDIPLNCLTFGAQNDPSQQAQKLFSALRQFDALGAKRVFVRAPSTDGVGLGVYNRLLRSAAFRRITPPVIYGLTGQSGTGKSTVAKRLKEKGYLIIDGDVIARRIVSKGSEVLDRLAEEFGEDIIDEDGNLIRSALAQKAFSSEENRQKLNAITHPAITKIAISQIKNNFTAKNKGVIIDAAALLDSSLVRYCTKMIVVTAPLKTRLERIISRDGIDYEAAMLRINAQPDEQYFIENSDIVIRNYEPFTLSDELEKL